MFLVLSTHRMQSLCWGVESSSRKNCHKWMWLLGEVDIGLTSSSARKRKFRRKKGNIYRAVTKTLKVLSFWWLWARPSEKSKGERRGRERGRDRERDFAKLPGLARHSREWCVFLNVRARELCHYSLWPTALRRAYTIHSSFIQNFATNVHRY